MTNGEIIEALELIVAVDQTPHYEQGMPRPWDGEYPHTGGHWQTPREIAQAALRRIRQENQ
jgi:hypothetical protein